MHLHPHFSIYTNLNCIPGEFPTEENRELKGNYDTTKRLVYNFLQFLVEGHPLQVKDIQFFASQ
jgi:hypothetical protein